MSKPVQPPRAIVLMGPTASGKTGLAMELARRFPLEVISVDSAQVYREMDIGTAKPTAEELKACPHRLIDILDPTERYSAARFRDDALREMADIHASGRIPLLAGGTMLYFRALLRGLSPLPSADPEVRARIEQEAGEKGWARMHQRLERLDPEAANRIHPNDPQRIQRALEVIELTGQPMTLLQQQGDKDTPRVQFLKIALMPEDRAELHRRIEQRFHGMLDAGFLDEVRSLCQRGDLHPDMPSMRSVGYRQAWRHLEGEIDLADMTRTAIEATRQLAKRQITWLRRERDALCYDSGKEMAEQNIFSEVQCFLESPATSH